MVKETKFNIIEKSLDGNYSWEIRQILNLCVLRINLAQSFIMFRIYFLI